MMALWRDLSYGARVLIKDPGFTAVAVIVLALGIGANTAIFSVVNGVLLKPLPYPRPERLVTLWERNPRKGVEQENVSPPDFADWRAQSHAFTHLASWSGAGEFNLVGTDGVEVVRAVYGSSGLLPALGVSPLLGRAFLPEEDQPEGNRVALIGYEFWQRRFAGASDVLGRTLTVDTFGRRDYTIVGVLPPGFRFPGQTEIWLPAGWDGLPRDRRGGHWLSVLARLKDGVTLATARAEMDAIQARIAREHPDAVIGTHVAVVPLLEQTLGARVRPALLTLWGVVACVLLIACANVANLSLARGAARRKEVAVRLALGATRLRVARQLLAESLLLALAGGALGALLGAGVLRLILAFDAGHIPRLLEVQLNGGVLLFTLLISAATGMLFGLAPAWHCSRPDLNEALKDAGRGATAGWRRSRLRGLLVVAQVTLALILLIGAGLMARSFVGLTRIDRGFRTERLLTARLDFSVSGFTTWIRPEATRPQVTLREVMTRLGNLPGVQAVGAISTLPHEAGPGRGQTIAIENRPPEAAGTRPKANFQGVTPAYFRAMGIPLLRGRAFTEADAIEASPVAVINESMARRHFPNEDPVGRRLAMYGRNPAQLVNPNPLARSPWIEIVGVVGDVKRLTLDAATVPDVFMPYWQWPMQTPALVVRATADTAGIAAAIRDEVRAVNPRLPAPPVRAMEEVLADVVAQPRFYTALSGLFGVTALLLAALGIYGVLSYVVAQRTSEIGIRLALGARRRDVLGLILGQGMRLVLTGAVIGVAGSAALARLLRSLLFGVSAADPLTFAGAALLLILVALLACYLPARRATRVDPLVALRHE